MPDTTQHLAPHVTHARHLKDHTAPMPAVAREGKHRRTLLTPKKVTVAALVKQHTAAAS